MDENKAKALKAQLEVAIEEEASDAEKYMKMADEADDKYACILRDIAHEELTHRKHLMAIHEDMTGMAE